MSYRIITDTSANLPESLAAEYGLTVIPFKYYIDGKEHTCLNTAAFNGKEYYDLIRNGKKITTSQINPQDFIDVFEPILRSEEDVLFVSMSSGISGSYNSSCVAAEELKAMYPEREIITIDTMGASLGEGLAAIKAAEYKSQGFGITETAQYIRGLCRRMYQVFTVDDLMHLKRTGRLSGTAAFVGTMLQIKPLLKGNEKGQIVNFDKRRGRRNAIKAMAEKYDILAVTPEEQVIGIAHADCPEDAEYLTELLSKNRPPKKILNVCYEPVTGSHVGPAALALFFEGSDDVRWK